MKGYLSLIDINLKLAIREKIVLFFNFLFPLVFFFIFGQMLDASRGGVGTRVVSMVLVLGVLGNGLFGAGVRAVVERENNILRRYKVTPISAAPILVASIVTGWLLYVPVILIVIGLAHAMWGMEIPRHWISLLILLSAGACAMRAIGLIVASVANTTAESNIIVQLLYMPMLFLSGAAFPISALPEWAQAVSQFLPATYLHNGMERVMIRNEGLADNMSPVLALLLSTVVATFISVKIFRWEKEEVLPAKAKLWLLVVGLPFIAMGVYQTYTRDNIEEAKALDREIRRNRTRLIRGARIFVGDGGVIESGGLLIRNGRIAEVYDGAVPDPDSLSADVVEAAGKTVLPGLIDVGVNLSSPGGVPANPEVMEPNKWIERALAAYLYSGVTAVLSAGDALDTVLKIRGRVSRGELLGAELFACGPLFTTKGGHGTEYLAELPEVMRAAGEKQFLRMPGSAEEARRQVQELKEAGVDAIEAVLDSGASRMVFNRMDLGVLRAVAGEARKQRLPLIVYTGGSRDVSDAVTAGAAGVQHGAMRDRISDELLTQMAERGVFYDPTLAAGEASNQLAEGRLDLLSRSLVEQVAPKGMLEATRAALSKGQWSTAGDTVDLGIARDNLLRAYRAGVSLVTGTGSGNPLLLHGPAIHRELQLWVQAGIPPAAALQAATHKAARHLGAGGRTGLVRQGYEATLLIVDGNPLEDITATERISLVFFKGERVNRPALFGDED